MKRLIYLSVMLLYVSSGVFLAQSPDAFNIDVNSFLNPSGFTDSINLLIALSSISLVPFFLISATSFLRTVIVLSMIRQALGTQSSPPNPVIIALAIFMTIFVMTPTFNDINMLALKPYREGVITQNEAIQLGVKPFRNFMLKFIRDKDLALFLEFSQLKTVQDYETVPIFVLIPAYVISELKN